MDHRLQNTESEDVADNLQRQSSIPRTEITYGDNGLESQAILSRHATIENLPLLEEETTEVFESSHASSTSNSPSPGKQEVPTRNRTASEKIYEATESFIFSTNSIANGDDVSQDARYSQRSFTSALTSLGPSRGTQKRRDSSASSSYIESSVMPTSTSKLRRSSSASLGSKQSTSRRRGRRTSNN